MCFGRRVRSGKLLIYSSALTWKSSQREVSLTDIEVLKDKNNKNCHFFGQAHYLRSSVEATCVCLDIVIYSFLLCLLLKVCKQCAVAFRRLLQLAVK